MGFLKDAKANLLGQEARKAVEAGDALFTPFLNTPSSQPGMTGNIRDWSLMIQAVEAEGWRLDQWTVAADNKGRAQAYPLFRRA
jgi:hypothetical protein